MFSKVKVKDFDIQTFFSILHQQQQKSWHKSSITKSNKTRRDEKGEKTLVPVCWMVVMENRTKNGIFFLWSMMMISDDFIAVFPLENDLCFNHNFFWPLHNKRKDLWDISSWR